MKKVLLLILVMGLSACTTFAPPRPPSCDDSIDGMRPINPDMISAEEMAAHKREVETETPDPVENVYEMEN